MPAPTRDGGRIPLLEDVHRRDWCCTRVVPARQRIDNIADRRLALLPTMSIEPSSASVSVAEFFVRPPSTKLTVVFVISTFLRSKNAVPSWKAMGLSPPKRAAMVGMARHEHDMAQSRTAPQAFLVAVIVLSALAAAAAAHFLLDFIGDFALAHDSYDGMAHGSRLLSFLIVTFLAAAGAVRLIVSALDGANASTAAFRALVGPLLALSEWRFIAAVATGALAGVITMQSVDSLLSGVRVDDIADALGGSAPLGLAVTLVVSTAIGAAVSRLFRALAAAHDAIVEIVSSLFIDARPHTGSASAMRTSVTLRSFARPLSVLSTRAGKRAPPPLFA